MKKLTLVASILIFALNSKSQITQSKNGLSTDPINSKIVELGGATTNTAQIDAAKFLSNREIFMNRYNLAFTDGGSSHHLSNSIQLGGASYSTPLGKLDIRNNNFHNGLILNTNQDTAIEVRGIYITNCVGSTIANYGIESNVSGTNASENIGIKASSSNGSLNKAGLFVTNAGTNSSSVNYGSYNTSNGGKKSFGGYFKASGGNITNYGIYAEATPYTGSVSWAGYFAGDININGAAFCTSGLWSGSDKRFKKDIKKLENINDKLKKVSGYTYYLNSKEFQTKNFDNNEQIGLMAQEVMEVFPQLVKEDKTGYLAVNYQGMIPVLLEAIKEQQKSIDELKNQIKEIQNVSASKVSSSHNSITLSDRNSIILNQNSPNPFAENTTLSYSVPQKFSKAQIIFTTTEGKVIMVYEIKESGTGMLNIFAGDLTSGLYSYSLIVDNTVIETKKMIKE